MRLVWVLYEGNAELEGHHEDGTTEFLGGVEGDGDRWTAYLAEDDGESWDIGKYAELIEALQAVEVALQGGRV